MGICSCIEVCCIRTSAGPQPVIRLTNGTATTQTTANQAITPTTTQVRPLGMHHGWLAGASSGLHFGDDGNTQATSNQHDPHHRTGNGLRHNAASHVLGLLRDVLNLPDGTPQAAHTTPANSLALLNDAPNLFDGTPQATFTATRTTISTGDPEPTHDVALLPEWPKPDHGQNAQDLNHSITDGDDNQDD